MRIEEFEMERMQSIHWHEVEYDLSESGVTPLTIAELLGEDVGPLEFLATKLAYPLSEGSVLVRDRIASWYPGAQIENVTTFDLSSRNRFGFVGLDVGYQIPASAYQLTDTSNIVIDHVPEQQHGRCFQCIRICHAIILIDDHPCIPSKSMYCHGQCICFSSRVKFAAMDAMHGRQTQLM
jgi:hypothetical protein